MAYQKKIPSPKAATQTKAPAPNLKTPKPMKAAPLPSMMGKQGFTNQQQSPMAKKKK